MSDSEDTTIREITLLLNGITLGPGSSVNFQVTVENNRVRVQGPPGIATRPVTVQSLPIAVANLANRLRSPGGLDSTLARIQRAYELGQNLHRCGIGEDHFPAGDVRPNLPTSVWVVHGVRGDFTKEPALFYSGEDKRGALGTLNLQAVSLGFASQAEGEACLVGAGSSLDSAVREGRAWRRERQQRPN